MTLSGDMDFTNPPLVFGRSAKNPGFSLDPKSGAPAAQIWAPEGVYARRRRKILGFPDPFYTENPSLECILERVFGVKEDPKYPKISDCGGRIPPAGGQICAAGAPDFDPF